METEKMVFNIAPGSEHVEITLRQGDAPIVLDPRPPVKINLNGTINAPLEFLKQRADCAGDNRGQFDIKRSHIVVDREAVEIKLVINENDEYSSGKVVGSLQTNPKMHEFGINTDRRWEPNELGQYLKMNRAFFEDKQENMALVTILKNFVATVDTKIEKQKAENGDFKDNYAGVVTSNLPGTFKLQIPLFKGMPKETIEVEFYASVSGRTILLQLVSPDAMATFEDVRDKVIDEQIAMIKEVQPELLIIEK